MFSLPGIDAYEHLPPGSKLHGSDNQFCANVGAEEIGRPRGDGFSSQKMHGSMESQK